MRVLQSDGVVEIREGEGLEALLGKKVTLFCANYFYTGTLIGVDETCVKLQNPAIVYETGSFSDPHYRDEQSLCVNEFYIQIGAIESFGILK